MLRLKQAKDVCLLSHQATVDVLRRSIVSVLSSLHHEAAECNEPTAVRLKSFMLQYFFVVSLSPFADVLPYVASCHESCKTVLLISVSYSQ